MDRNGAGAEQATRAGHGVTDIVDLPPITAQQVTQATSSTVTAAGQSQQTLAPYVKPEVKRRNIPKPKPGTDVFVQAMANLQTKYSTQLGHLNTDPTTMLQKVSVAAAANEAAAPLFVLGGQLTDIANGNLDEARKDATAIYNRGKAVMAAYPEIAKDLAPFADANSRIGKKGANTRKKEKKAKEAEQAQAGTAATPATGGGSTTTTTTTSQK